MLIGIKNRRDDTIEWLNSEHIQSFSYDPEYRVTGLHFSQGGYLSFDGDITEELLKCFDKIAII
jgi:hypothetical protein